MIRQCYVCGAELTRREGERPNKWHQRQTCSDECKRVRTGQVQSGVFKTLDRKHWATELQPWPKGIKFGKLALPETGTIRLVREETHRPYETSAAWAVGGGGDV